MKVSIEAYLLDNLMMNYLVLRLACTFFGARAKRLGLFAMSLFGAVYALLSASVLPVLSGWVPKLLLGCLMALPLKSVWRDYPRAVFSVYLSSCLMGGVMFGISLLFGGSFSGGTFVCTVPVRIALASACVCALLPRVVLTLIHTLRSRAERVRVEVRFRDRTFSLDALVDSGNLLREPISGKSVVVVKKGLLPGARGLPVPYRTIDGEGIIYAMRPQGVRVYQGCWREVDALVAEANTDMLAADAIFPAGLLRFEGGTEHDADHKEATGVVLRGHPQAKRGDLVCALKRGAARALQPGGGAELDRAPRRR